MKSGQKRRETMLTSRMWAERGNDRDRKHSWRKAGGRGQLPDTAPLCVPRRPGRMLMPVMLMMSPLRPVALKGRHSITQSRSGVESASLHLSASNGPSAGYQGRWALNKGGIRSSYESSLLFWAPLTPTEVTGVRGVPWKMARLWGMMVSQCWVCFSERSDWLPW